MLRPGARPEPIHHNSANGSGLSCVCLGKCFRGEHSVNSEPTRKGTPLAQPSQGSKLPKCH
eukprot:11233212-Alexandrium_andersonii.AAC.1